jgi:hypothetical protein
MHWVNRKRCAQGFKRIRSAAGISPLGANEIQKNPMIPMEGQLG